MRAGGPVAREGDRCLAKGPTETKLQSESSAEEHTGSALTAEREDGAGGPARRKDEERS